MSDRIIRNRLLALSLVLLLAAGIGMCGPLWEAMPWYVAP